MESRLGSLNVAGNSSYSNISNLKSPSKFEMFGISAETIVGKNNFNIEDMTIFEVRLKKD